MEKTASASFAGELQNESLDVLIDSLPESFHPHNCFGVAAKIIFQHLSEPVIGLGPRGEYLFGLIQSYSVLADGLTFRFQLAENYKFHDNSPVTASDVIYSLQSHLDSQGQHSAMHHLIQHASRDKNGITSGFRRISKLRFEIILNSFAPDFISFLAHANIPVLRADREFDAKTSLCGPYRFVELSESSFTVKIFEGHPRCSQAKFLTVNFRILSLQNQSIYLQNSCVSLGMSPSVVPLSQLGRALRHSLQSCVGVGFLLQIHCPLDKCNHIRSILNEILSTKYVREHYPLFEFSQSFFPAAHTLYYPLEAPVVPHQDINLSLRIHLNESLIPHDLLGRLRERAALRGLVLWFVLGDAQHIFSQADAENAPFATYHAHLISYDITHQEAGTALRSSFSKIAHEYSAIDAKLKSIFRIPLRDQRKFSQNVRAFQTQLLLQAQCVPIGFLGASIALGQDLELRDAADSNLSGYPIMQVRRRSAQQDIESLRRTKLEIMLATTQMFAHDVRKPFTLMKMILDMIQRAKSLDDMKLVSERMLPEVTKSMNSINGLIRDIMDIGSHPKLETEFAAPEALIEAAINEVFLVHRKSGIEFSYELKHTHLAEIDVPALARVLTNLLTNAVQAMSTAGSIWFKTENIDDAERGWIQFTVGNSGSFIPSEDREKIFESFFTRGKRGGTGLGLAISQRLITAHGGTIRCFADLESGVEFVFTVPESTVPRASAAHYTLPTSTEALELLFHAQSLATLGAELDSSADEEELEFRIVNLVRKRGFPIKLLVIDDEVVYRSALKWQLKRSPELFDAIDIRSASDAGSALQEVRTSVPDVCLCDFDLGHTSIDGIELSKLLLQENPAQIIYIHSNQNNLELRDAAKSAGTKGFLPKPLARKHLLSLLAETLDSSQNKSLNICILDDNFVVLQSWKQALKNHVVTSFFSPDAFWLKIASNADYLAKLDIVITDLHFDASSTDDGISFAQALKKVTRIPILLATNDDISALPDGIDAVVSKDKVSDHLVSRWVQRVD